MEWGHCVEASPTCGRSKATWINFSEIDLFISFFLSYLFTAGFYEVTSNASCCYMVKQCLFHASFECPQFINGEPKIWSRFTLLMFVGSRLWRHGIHVLLCKQQIDLSFFFFTATLFCQKYQSGINSTIPSHTILTQLDRAQLKRKLWILNN